MANRLSKTAQDVLPPWLWLWLGASLLLTFRAGPASWLGEGAVLFTGYPEIGTQVPIFRTVGLAFVVPVAVILAGAVTIALPWARAAYLERRFGLKESSVQVPSLKEISDFVHTYEPDLEIKVNLARPNQLAFVYPLGYRKAALAVFGGLIILWGQERSSAESVLLHEIGHRRHGDILIVGAGSLLTTFVRYGLLVGTVGLAVGFAALAVDMAVPDSLRQALYFGRMLLLAPIVAILVAVPILILPLVGMWCAEFNADRFALEAQRSSDAMIKAVEKLRPRKSRWRWLLLWMTHPPDTLRRWAVRHYNKRGTLVVLLLLFPVATFISALCQFVWDTYLFFDTGALLNAADTSLDLLAPRWLAIAAIVLLWPLVAGLWDRLFSGGPPVAGTSEGGEFRGYIYTCVLLVGLVGVYYGVSPKAVLQPGPVPAGEYSTTYFDPGFSFQVDGGWEAAPPGDTPGLVLLGRENTGEIRFQNIGGTHLNFYDNTGKVGIEHVIPPPPLRDNGVLWYAALIQHPNLHVTVPRLAQVGGVNFFEFDVELSSKPQSYPQGCSRPCVPLFHYSHFNTQGKDFFLKEGNKLRLLVTVIDDKPLMIAIGATTQGFSGFLNQAAGVLGSVKWDADVSSSVHTETPNLVGKTPDAAASLAGPDFAAVQVGHTRVTNEPKGTIISQDPRPGESVPKGTIIWVDVSAGRPEDPGDILEEDFSDTSSGWPSDTNSDGTSLGYGNNNYLISMEQPGPQGVWFGEAALPGSTALGDSVIEVDATSSTANNKPEGVWGVTCRMANADTSYLLAVDNSGGAFIWRLENGVPSELADNNDLTSSVVKQGTATLTGVDASIVREGTATNHIRGDCLGSTLTLYVNGQKAAEAENVQPTSGGVGLYVMNLSDQAPGIKVAFDNFRVSSPPSTSAPSSPPSPAPSTPSSSASSSPSSSASASASSSSALPASTMSAPPSSASASSSADEDAEAAVLDAASAYYQYAENGDYHTTYDLLSQKSQDYFTEDAWVTANNVLDSAAGEFVVTGAYPDDLGLGVPTYAVTLTVYSDGSSFNRTTYFVNEGGHWAHYLSSEETSMFSNAVY